MKTYKLFSLIILCLFISTPLVASSASSGDAVMVYGDFVITDTISTPSSNSPPAVYASASTDEDLSLQAASYGRSIIITEVGADQIELQNVASSTINITAYTLELTYDNASKVTIVIEEVIEIAVDAYYVLDSTNTNLNASTIDLQAGILELKSGSTSYQDVVAWGHLGKAPAIPVGSSISRSSLTPFQVGVQPEFVVSDDWSISTSTTLGTVNDVVAPELNLSSIILSELFSNGSDSFIEIINLANESIDIEDYTLYVNNSLVHTFAAETLTPSGTAIFETTDDVVTPTGNLYLYNSSGARIGQMGWNDLIAGFSFSRFLNFTYDYSEFDDMFVYDTEQQYDYRKIEVDSSFEWDYYDGYNAELSGFSYSEPTRDAFNINTLEILTVNASSFFTARKEDVGKWINESYAPVIGLYNVSVYNNGSLTIPHLNLYTYFDGGVDSPDPRVVKLPLFNWTNIEYEVFDFAPGDWLNVTVKVTTVQNGTAHNINFLTMNDIVVLDSVTSLNISQAKAKITGFFNPSRYEAGKAFIANVTLTNTGTYIAENINFTLRPGAIDSFGTDRLNRDDDFIWSHVFDEQELDVREAFDVSFNFTGVQNIWDPVKFVKIKFRITYSTKDLDDNLESFGYLKVFILSPSLFNPFAWENPFAFVIWVLTGIFSMWWVSRWFYRASKPKPRPEPTEYVYPENIVSEPDDT